MDATRLDDLGQPARARLMRGLGGGIHPRNVAYDAFDEVHWVGRPSPPTPAASSPPATSSAAAGAPAPSPWSPHGPRGCTPEPCRHRLPDGPQRSLNSVYDDDFATAHGLDLATAATRPVEIPHPTAAEATGWTRCGTVTDPLVPPGATGDRPPAPLPGPAPHRPARPTTWEEAP